MNAKLPILFVLQRKKTNNYIIVHRSSAKETGIPQKYANKIFHAKLAGTLAEATNSKKRSL
jgi:hypothetical protein